MYDMDKAPFPGTKTAVNLGKSLYFAAPAPVVPPPPLFKAPVAESYKAGKESLIFCGSDSRRDISASSQYDRPSVLTIDDRKAIKSPRSREKGIKKAQALLPELTASSESIRSV